MASDIMAAMATTKETTPAAPDPHAVGRRLKEARTEYRLDDGSELEGNALCRMAGVALGTVSRIEAGERPELSAPVLGKLARVLNVRMDWLWAGEGPKRATGRTTERDDPYPNRAAAIASRGKMWSAETVARVREWAFDQGPIEQVDWWLQLGDAYEAGKTVRPEIVTDDPVTAAKKKRKQ